MKKLKSELLKVSLLCISILFSGNSQLKAQTRYSHQNANLVFNSVMTSLLFLATFPILSAAVEADSRDFSGNGIVYSWNGKNLHSSYPTNDQEKGKNYGGAPQNG